MLAALSVVDLLDVYYCTSIKLRVGLPRRLTAETRRALRPALGDLSPPYLVRATAFLLRLEKKERGKPEPGVRSRARISSGAVIPCQGSFDRAVRFLLYVNKKECLKPGVPSWVPPW